jgi:AcrR family transcriptional regulator
VARFTVADVENAGLRVLDREGLDALSMRKVADELGTGVMTLYGYVRTRDELVDRLAGRIFAAIDVAPAPGASWRVQLADALTAMHESMKTHPGAVDLLMLPRPMIGPTLDHVRDGLLRIVRTAGLDVDEAVAAIAASLSFVVGFTVLETAPSRREPRDEETARLRQLPAQEFPFLVEAADSWTHRSGADVFEAGLRNIVDGIELRVRASARSARATSGARAAVAKSRK